MDSHTSAEETNRNNSTKYDTRIDYDLKEQELQLTYRNTNCANLIQQDDKEYMLDSEEVIKEQSPEQP